MQENIPEKVIFLRDDWYNIYGPIVAGYQIYSLDKLRLFIASYEGNTTFHTFSLFSYLDMARIKLKAIVPNSDGAKG